MKPIEVTRYTPAMREEWDDFVCREAVNSTFLHQRAYMDYHADRFTDCSLIARYAGENKLLALLPANIEEDGTVCSHRGLTYGGLLVGRHSMPTSQVMAVMENMADKFREIGARQLIYKPVPSIYSRYPAEDDVYALWRMGGCLLSCQPSSVIPLDQPMLTNYNERRALRQAIATGMTVAEEYDLHPFWELLAEVLRERHGVSPVHSVEEMELLRSRFPENIRLYTARIGGRLLGGILMYYAGPVAHNQYTAISPDGFRSNALEAIINHIISKECDGRRWWDFGTSCEHGGRELNATLNAKKYYLGCRPVLYTTYTLSL